MILIRSYVGFVPLMAVLWSRSHLGERTLPASLLVGIFLCRSWHILLRHGRTNYVLLFPQDVFVEAIEVGWVGGCAHGWVLRYGRRLGDRGIGEPSDKQGHGIGVMGTRIRGIEPRRGYEGSGTCMGNRGDKGSPDELPAAAAPPGSPQIRNRFGEELLPAVQHTSDSADSFR